MRGALLGAMAAAAAGGLAYAAACPVAQVWGRGFHRGPRGKRQIALTFDDGPSEWTPAIAECLARHDAVATFFCCGRNVERRPELARQLREAGHEIGNHTYSHPLLLACPPARVYAEVAHAQEILEQASGATPRFFRPPFGCRAPSLRWVLPDLGLIAVMWSVIGNDWKWPAEKIAQKVLRGAGAGAVVCLHDGREARDSADRRETLRALKTILPEMRRQGYGFVTVAAMWENRVKASPAPGRAPI